MGQIKQTTSIEWFIEELFKKIDYTQVPQKLINQAKEMDKEQKRNMFDCGRQYQLTGEGTFKEVYDEIYGSK
jgi:N-acetylglutamate synthase-like GNAT family acetyltransferase